MTMSRRLIRRQDALAAPVDDEIVLLPPSFKHYIALDPIGRRVWELLETPHTSVALSETLAGEFAADAEQILADLLPLLGKFEQEGLIRPTA